MNDTISLEQVEERANGPEEVPYDGTHEPPPVMDESEYGVAPPVATAK